MLIKQESKEPFKGAILTGILIEKQNCVVNESKDKKKRLKLQFVVNYDKTFSGTKLTMICNLYLNKYTADLYKLCKTMEKGEHLILFGSINEYTNSDNTISMQFYVQSALFPTRMAQMLNGGKTTASKVFEMANKMPLQDNEKGDDDYLF